MIDFDETRSHRTQPDLAAFQAIPMSRVAKREAKKKLTRRNLKIGVVVLILLYFFAPLRTNILFLGTDGSPLRGELGRTDTIILTTVVPFKPYVGMLGIPRDLWLEIPNVGEQRINTAYFYAEAAEVGTGAPAAVEAVSVNFGVKLRYYMVVHMLGVVDVVDALGGLDITLDQKMGTLKKGEHHLDGTETLAFVRERYSSSDLSRMEQGQIVLGALTRKLLSPSGWLKLPALLTALPNAIETNIPFWQLPRLGFAFVRGTWFGMDNRTIDWEMVTPYETSGGAQVLLPIWDAINPVLKEMFGE